MNTLILDLDNTIIGNIKYQLLLYNLYIKTGKSVIYEKSYNENTHIIRNGFTNFIKNIKEKIPNIKIYIYTASSKEWALKEIKWIETNCNIKFNRPIFTRDDCINNNNLYYKSIKKISKKVKTIEKSNLLIIDNSDVFLDKKENFIQCPSYNFIYFVDIFEKIPLKYKNDKEIMRWILELSNQGFTKPHIISDYSDKMSNSIKNSEWLYKKLINISKNNKKYIEDKWWIKINNIISNCDIKEVSDIKKYISLYI
jgi:hypothetical protein